MNRTSIEPTRHDPTPGSRRSRRARRASAERLDADSFRPILSIRNGCAWAVEAPLSTSTSSGLERFVASERSPDLAVALRIDPERIVDFENEAAHLAAELDRFGIPRGRLVIEIVEHDIDDLEALVRFSRESRELGMLVAVVHVGTGHPSAERIVRLAPDALAIDPTVVRGVSSAPARREACRAITELARSIGALVVADGVDEIEDLLALAILGIDLFQGRVVASRATDLASAARAAAVRAAELRARLRERAELELSRRREERASHERVFVAVVTRLAHARAPMLDALADAAVREIPGLEALYVLDHRGVQITETFMQPGLVPRSGFRPAPRGTDLGLKDYYLEVSYGASAYVSRPYVSMASGRLCVTHSRRVRIADGSTVIVCCDVPSAV